MAAVCKLGLRERFFALWVPPQSVAPQTSAIPCKTSANRRKMAQTSANSKSVSSASCGTQQTYTFHGLLFANAAVRDLSVSFGWIKKLAGFRSALASIGYRLHRCFGEQAMGDSLQEQIEAFGLHTAQCHISCMIYLAAYVILERLPPYRVPGYPQSHCGPAAEAGREGSRGAGTAGTACQHGRWLNCRRVSLNPKP